MSGRRIASAGRAGPARTPPTGERDGAGGGAGALRDPGVRAMLVLVVLVVVGYSMLWLGWRGVARTMVVPFQAPWAMSAGLGSLAVLAMALGGGSIHIGRRQDAEHRAAMEQLVRDAVLLIEDVQARRRVTPPEPRRRGAPATRP